MTDLPPALHPNDRRLTDWADSALGHRFADIALLRRAVTHTSHGDANNERLEFLGDRVLGLMLARWVFDAFPTESEGVLTNRFHALVSRVTCAEIAREIGLEPLARLGPMPRDNDRALNTILGDAVEALIGALFLDGGMAAAENFVRRAWGSRIADAPTVERHPKSTLQEWAATRGRRVPVYEALGKHGPAHAPRFRVRVAVGDLTPVEAEGGSKQEAETAAALAMLAAVKA